MIFPLGIGLLFLFLLLLTPSPSQASTLFDPAYDVKYQNTGEIGRLMEAIDIYQVDTEGAMVIITCGSPLPLREPGLIHRYLVMFSHDGDPTDWEAAILFTSLGDNTVELSWKIGAVTFEEALAPDDWPKLYDIGHYTLVDNAIYLSFTEYHATSYAELAVWTEVINTDANGNKHIFHDWAPNSLEEWSFEASEEIQIAEPASEEPSSEPTSESSSEPQRSTGPAASSTTVIPGFGLLMVLASIPLLLFLQKRQNRK